MPYAHSQPDLYPPRSAWLPRHHRLPARAARANLGKLLLGERLPSREHRQRSAPGLRVKPGKAVRACRPKAQHRIRNFPIRHYILNLWLTTLFQMDSGRHDSTAFARTPDGPPIRRSTWRSRTASMSVVYGDAGYASALALATPVPEYTSAQHTLSMACSRLWGRRSQYGGGSRCRAIR